MKGVLICGGMGSRLRPLTEITNKSLLPVYDRPLMQYPLQLLLDAGLKDIAVITGPEHMEQMMAFLGSGSRFGCAFVYRVQERPGGIAEALGLAEDFADGEPVCAILGDNIFFDDLTPMIHAFRHGGHVFLKEVSDPKRFGVASLAPRQAHGDRARDDTPSVIDIEEKPQHPRSNLAVTGCYLYDARCFDAIRRLKPSSRGELEITDVSKWYLDQGELTASVLADEWVDAGTFESLFQAARLVRSRRSAAVRSSISVS